MRGCEAFCAATTKEQMIGLGAFLTSVTPQLGFHMADVR
jgi:hypothetical protein